jgi:hypothetical protein
VKVAVIGDDETVTNSAHHTQYDTEFSRREGRARHLPT